MNLSDHSQFIRNTALRLGFDQCGIAAARPLDDDARRLEQWLKAGRQGTMSYMERHFDLRIDPRKLVPGARSVITLLMNYYPETLQQGLPKVAKYAYGQDYHDVIRNKLNTLLHEIRTHVGEVQGRGFVDSAPVLERSWARLSGLGWIGKNGNLIRKKSGSFFFIATLITDLPLTYDNPYTHDHCGTCPRCIDACPTEAILPDKVIDGSRCISYFTIELKEQLIPGEMKGRFDGWMFGCDVCQDVCPWNRFSTPTREPAVRPLPEILNYRVSDWEALTEEAFPVIFRSSPLKRSRYAGIRRNLTFIHTPA